MKFNNEPTTLQRMLGKTVGKKINQDFSLKLNPRANNFTIAIPQPSRPQPQIQTVEQKSVQVRQKSLKVEVKDESGQKKRCGDQGAKRVQLPQKPEFKKKWKNDKQQGASKSLVQPLQSLALQPKHPDRKINISDLLKEMKHLESLPITITPNQDTDEWTKYIKKNCKSLQPNTDIPEPVVLQDVDQPSAKETQTQSREAVERQQVVEEQGREKEMEEGKTTQKGQNKLEGTIEIKVKKFIKKQKDSSPVKKNQNKNQANKIPHREETRRPKIKQSRQKEAKDKQSRCQTRQHRQQLIKKMVQDEMMSFEEIEKMLVSSQQKKEEEQEQRGKEILFTNEKLQRLGNDLFRLDFHQLVNKSQISI